MTNSIPSQQLQWVALDLETTGLSTEADAIIEVGAVRFTFSETLDEFQTFVNPRRQLTEFIRDFTGITQSQVDAAPPLSNIAPYLLELTSGATVVAHNADFDLGFLRAGGLDVERPVCDTWELAYLALPNSPSYALDQLASAVSAPVGRAHRALNDARAVRDVFLALVPMLAELDPRLLAEFRRLSQRSGWRIGPILDSVDQLVRSGRGASPTFSAAGIDSRKIATRLARPKPLRPAETDQPVDADLVCDALSFGSGFAGRVPGFEERPQQIQMARAVAETINSGSRLLVEAGTGVGKSLAYLLPAALYATANDRRIVVSTNTINLQEQLIQKDLPMVRDALREINPIAADKFRFTQLKGRANYVCFKRWSQTRFAADLDPAQARLIAKTLTWVPTTSTGDRSELNLGHRGAAASWERLSAQRAHDCPSQTGPCFLRAARDKAAASHIIVVNHALLMSDVAAGGSAIPDYDLLIVDEAHHLEDEATRQLGFSIGPSEFADLLGELMGERGLLLQCVMAVQRRTVAASGRAMAEEATSVIQALVPMMREEIARLFTTLARFAFPTRARRSEFAEQRLITKFDRESGDWKSVEQSWDRAAVPMADLSRSLSSLATALESIDPNDLPDAERLLSELVAVGQEIDTQRSRVAEFIAAPSEGGIYWVQEVRQSADVLLNSAPLHVGALLDETLYSEKSAAVLTSATLSTANSFDHIADRLGFDGARHLALGSPFDFHASTLLYTPSNTPRPNSPGFHEHVGSVILDAASAAGGRTMVLFTSYGALRTAAAALRAPLAQRGIQVLAQGVDGPPRQIASRFAEAPASVLLGTNSFWEGVDFAGDALKVLIVARLPFLVPSDPVVQARSAQYRNPFLEFALPQAIIRFRQGFGRLIRTSSDRGVVIVLDSRISTQRYGSEFIKSLPKVRVTDGLGAPVGEVVRKWMDFAR